MASRRTPHAAARPAWTKHAVVGVVIVGLLGTTCGTVCGAVFPTSALFAADRARQLLERDTAADLQAAIDAVGDDAELVGVAALAGLLLWLEHGGGDDVKAAALQKLEKAAGPARTTPEALYARALLVTTTAGTVDARLADDLAAAGTDAWTQLARATVLERNAAASDDDLQSAAVLVERAALAAEPLPHATHRLARIAARRGDLHVARASLERLFRLAPEHVGGAITAAFLGVVEALVPVEQRRRPPRIGKPTPGQNAQADLDEQRLQGLLESSDDARDRRVVGLALALLRHRRGDVPATTWTAPLLAPGLPNDARSTGVATQLALLVGDVDSAEAFGRQAPATTLPAQIDVARTRFLRAVPDDERRAAQKAARSTSLLPPSTASVALPLGTVVVDFAVDGVPVVLRPSASFFPERRLLRLVVDVEAGDRDRLEPRLVAVEKLGLVERAIARGDLAAANALLKEARVLAGADADVALTEAALRARENDKAGVQTAVAAALTAAPLDPAVLLSAARLGLDVDDLAVARRALTGFARLGFKSAGASAVTALLEARSGDPAAARAALVEAKRLGGADDTDALRARILVNRASDVVDARAAADVLLARGDHGDAADGDVVAAWIAEAAFRKGEHERAQAALKAITTARPDIAEAQLFYAQSIAFFPHLRTEALTSTMKALKGLVGSPLLGEAKKLFATLKAAR